MPAYGLGRVCDRGEGSVKPSAISTAKLNALLRLHLRPIKQVVYLRPYSFPLREGWQILSWGGLRT